MSTPPSSSPPARSNARSRAASPSGELGQLIEKDIACESCGYSLRGLYTKGSCPECGTAIRAKKPSDVQRTDTLVDAPLGYLKRLVIATSATAVVGVMMTLGQLYLAVYSFPGRELVQAVSPLLWMGAVFLVTMRRPLTDATPGDLLLDSAWFRWLVRSMQAAWPAGVALLVGPQMLASLGVAVPGWTATTATVFGSLLVFVAAIGLAPLCLYLASLADWAQASGMGERLRTAAFFTGVFGVLSVLLSLVSMVPGLLLAPIAGVFSIITGVLALVGIGMLVVSMVQLAFLAYWAVKNWHDIQARDQRQEARRRAREAELAHRMSKIAAAQAAGIASHAPRVSAVEHRLERKNQSDEPIDVIGDGSPAGSGGSADSALGKRHFANEHVRTRDVDVSPYGLEPDAPDRVP